MPSLLLALALAVAAVGCASAPAAGSAPAAARVAPELLEFQNLLIPPGSCAAPLPEAIGADDARADLAVLERVLRRGYAGFEIRAREGLDWDALFADLRARVARAPFPMAPERFRALLLEGLAPVRDGHLALFSVGADGRWRRGAALERAATWVADVALAKHGADWTVVRTTAGGPPERARLVGCAGAQLHDLLRPTVLGDPIRPAALLAVRAASAPAPLACAFRTPRGAEEIFALALHALRSGARDAADAPAFERCGADVPVLRLRTLGTGRAEALEAFAASARVVREEPALVLDARGNPGGTDAPVTAWLRDLTSGTLTQSTVEQLVTEVTLQGEVNDYTFALEATAPDAAAGARFESDRALARRELVRARDRIGRPYREWRIRTPSADGLAPAPFAGRLVLLVDGGCASACETLVRYTRQLPGTIVVGDATAGMTRFGEVRPYRLPRSRLWLQAGSKWTHDGTGARFTGDGEGMAPDLWLDTDEPQPIAEALARCLAQPACAAAFGPRP